MLRQQLHSAVTSWVRFEEPQWHRFATLFHMRSLQEREHFFLPDASLDELCFVCSGLLRAYYLTDTGTESNKAFIAENEVAGPLPAAALELPVSCGIEALEPSTLLIARYADFAALLEDIPRLASFSTS
jgi:CRP-like cAMP-binding protein